MKKIVFRRRAVQQARALEAILRSLAISRRARFFVRRTWSTANCWRLCSIEKQTYVAVKASTARFEPSARPFDFPRNERNPSQEKIRLISYNHNRTNDAVELVKTSRAFRFFWFFPNDSSFWNSRFLARGIDSANFADDVENPVPTFCVIGILRRTIKRKSLRFVRSID